MIRLVAVLPRAARAAGRTTGAAFTCRRAPSLTPHSLSSKSSFCTNSGPNVNPVALQMINYALSHARSQKSDDSYAQAILILEQCLSTQSDENSKGTVLLAMSTLFHERGNFPEAIEKLQKIQDLNLSSIRAKVAATEALVGLHLELGKDDTASALADLCLQLLDTIKLEIGGRYGFDVLDARAKATKGLVDLVRGNIASAESLFQGAQNDDLCAGNIALSYGKLMHIKREFSMAKVLYEKAIQGMSENKALSALNHFGACNMAADEVHSAATCALGQLEAHLGNFDDAEEILTKALTLTEEHFGSNHPKVGVVLTYIALMYRHKAMLERSSSIMIQEGLYRKAIDLLKGPSLEGEEAQANFRKRDILALARGGYAEILCIQQNRKAEGERMKSWAESVWRNPRLSLAEALDISELSSKLPVIDTRISRVL